MGLYDFAKRITKLEGHNTGEVDEEELHLKINGKCIELRRAPMLKQYFLREPHRSDHRYKAGHASRYSANFSRALSLLITLQKCYPTTSVDRLSGKR